MFFKALTFFRFPTTLDLSAIDDALSACALKPVGPLEMASRGFVSPLGRDFAAVTHRCGDAIWLTVGGEERVLPSAVVDKVVAEKLEQLYAANGRRPGGRARRQLRDDIVAELLPTALVKPTRIDAMLDLSCGFIAVDTGSRKSAEAVVSEVRHALGSFPALPINAEVSPRGVMTGWIAGEPLLDGLVLGEDCSLQDPADGGGAVKCYRIELRGEEVAEHLRAGRQATRLALVLDDHVSFDLDERLVVRKLRFLDGAIDALLQVENDDVRAELDARFALMAGEVRRLFRVLEHAFRLTTLEDAP